MRISILNLILAILWLAFAQVAFLMPYLHPEGPSWVIPGTNISWGWFALFFFAYNLLRWMASRDRRKPPPDGSGPPRPTPGKVVHPEFDVSEAPRIADAEKPGEGKGTT